jgi:3-hydroxybutyryl-CoA dehydrogenase
LEGSDVRHVGVVGCGLMGSGIVEVAARSGARVTFVEGSSDLVERGHERIRASIRKGVERGKIEAADAEAALARISGADDLTALFARLGELVRPETILASNTSSIPIAELANALGRPDRVIGIHFFNPPPQMPLVELIAAETTSQSTLAFAEAWVASLGKTTVRSKDVAGFIVNRLLIPYLNDAATLLDQGVATRDDIDTAIRLGLAHPMGPLALADLIGIDTVVQIAEVLHEALGDDRYAPHPVLVAMVREGRLGRKAGAGFYDY